MNRHFRKANTLLHVIVCMYFLFALSSCGHGKALIDRSAMEKIIWPGPPEKPRIAFLWSVSTIFDRTEAGWLNVFAGEEDTSDPRSSGRLLRPYSIFVDDRGILYISDPGAYRITVIDPKTGDSKNILGADKEGFLYPIGIAAFQGKIYVSDSSLGKVFILDMDGNKTGEFHGTFQRPTTLAVDKPRGVVYVTDTAANKIYRYNLDGKRLGAIGEDEQGEAQFNLPTHISVDKKGSLYVTDAMNFRIQIYSPDGRLEKIFGTLGDNYGELEKPKGVAVDSDGNIYVVDSIKDMAKIFNRDGMLLLFWGETGQNFGQFYLPSGIFIDDKNYIYVADTYNGRVQVFKYLGGQ